MAHKIHHECIEQTMKSKKVITGFLNVKPTFYRHVIEPTLEVPSGDDYIAINGLEEITVKKYSDCKYKVKITIEVEKI